MWTNGKQAVAFLMVSGPNGNSVSGHYHKQGDCSGSISGYVGHDWTDDIDENTIGVDARSMTWDDRCTLAISGPMPDVDLPPGTMSRCFENGHIPYNGAARSLDYVSLDVWLSLWEAKGAIIIRGADAVMAFAEELSGKRPVGWSHV